MQNCMMPKCAQLLPFDKALTHHYPPGCVSLINMLPQTGEGNGLDRPICCPEIEACLLFR